MASFSTALMRIELPGAELQPIEIWHEIYLDTRPRASFHLDVCALHDRPPFGELSFYMGGKFIRCRADNRGAELLHAFGDGGVGERFLAEALRRITTSLGVFAGAKSAFQV